MGQRVDRINFIMIVILLITLGVLHLETLLPVANHNKIDRKKGGQNLYVLMPGCSIGILE